MSRPPAPGPGGAAMGALGDDLISYYRARSGQGQLGLCRQGTLISRARRLLDTEAPLGLSLSEDLVRALAGSTGVGPSPAQDVLLRALEFLELISVNLLLFPWRREIRALKTYTGSFAYWVRPVLPTPALHALLGRLGYTATSETEFSLARPVPEDAARQMALEIFLTRVACEAAVRGQGVQRLARPLCRRSSKRGLGKGRHLSQAARPGPGSRGPQQGPSEEAGSERCPDASTEPEHMWVFLNLPETSTTPKLPLGESPAPLGRQGPGSTRSDSEEFLTCYSDLALHRAPLFPPDHPLSSWQGRQLQDPASLLAAAAHPGGCGRQPLVPMPSQLCLVPGPQPPEAGQEQSPSDPGPKPRRVPSEMEELCGHFSHLLGPPIPAEQPTPGAFLALTLRRKNHEGPRGARGREGAAQTAGTMALKVPPDSFTY
ncbi:uncharacterized protein LOC142431436 [Tenrec ecaudatus]|uniref:uncharacterized protein LOC142431436 n=1 Tax=Tenrec ecaudatus TaxID=94439 RepID=UPI003F5A8175